MRALRHPQKEGEDRRAVGDRQQWNQVRGLSDFGSPGPVLPDAPGGEQRVLLWALQAGEGKDKGVESRGEEDPGWDPLRAAWSNSAIRPERPGPEEGQKGPKASAMGEGSEPSLARQ